MSLEKGFVKYIIKTPLTIVGFISMYIYGGFLMTLLNTFSEIFSGNFVNAFLEYFVYSALPPVSVEHVFIQVLVGTITAGTKWYIAMSKIKSGWC
ncbi:hypothetical protein HNV12_12015 [Methanococcoides sp. SA1]|nr:hypothetical protein [Methanococcoides sp. SA1]